MLVFELMLKLRLTTPPPPPPPLPSSPLLLFAPPPPPPATTVTFAYQLLEVVNVPVFAPTLLKE
jgi:hypothetical protein